MASILLTMTPMKSRFDAVWPIAGFLAAAGMVAAIAAGTMPESNANPAPPPDRVIIKDNGGGLVQEFIQTREKWRQAGTKVEFHGSCMSACTLFLDLDRVCAREGAEFWFHAPFREPMDGVVEYRDSGTNALLSEYPVHIRSMIRSNGGLTDKWLVLKGDLVTEYVPECQ